jgi:2-polyprenyl-6-methoxyphenol hydroxylase-like FAD-dependent oxidoreductase
MTPTAEDIPVLIAGGGPVGLMVARVLGRYGIPAMLVERNRDPTRHPKMDITNARSMELFRRFGLEDQLRDVAVPETSPFDVSWITCLSGHELHRFKYMSPELMRAHIRLHNDGTQPQVPAMRVSQVEIEPVMRAAVADEPTIESRFGVAFEDLTIEGDAVRVTLRDQDSGAVETVRCRYLVGCDGGASRVRACLGIGLDGEAAVAQRYMVHFRSTATDILQPFGIAWHYQSSVGTLIAQNDRDVWTLQTRPPDGVAPDKVDPHERLRSFAGTDFDYEIIVANSWTPHLLVADSYGTDRVFLAGDAAHQYIPTGGYGMNTGIGDAVDIGWKLAAVIKGCASHTILQTYDLERRPVGLRNREGSRRHTGVRLEIASVYEKELADRENATPAQRQKAANAIAALGNAENESWGLEFGYVYATSPIVCGETAPAAANNSVTYAPTPLPGARLPSIYLADGSALYDRLGPWFTLLSLSGTPSENWAAAASKYGIPLEQVIVDEPLLRDIYQSDLILVRPDTHVAWRGPISTSDNGELDDIFARTLGWEMEQ